MLTRRRLFGAAALAGLGAAVLATGLGTVPLDARAAAKEIRGPETGRATAPTRPGPPNIFEKEDRLQGGARLFHLRAGRLLTKLRTAPGNL